MALYELNNLGQPWIWEADTEEAATDFYLDDCLFTSLDEYVTYCKSVGADATIYWTQVQA